MFSNDLCFLFSFKRAYAEAGPSVQHSEQQEGEEDDFVSDSEEETLVESSKDDEAKDDGSEGKKKKARSGFRDRKVINERWTFSQVQCLIELLNRVWESAPIGVQYEDTNIPIPTLKYQIQFVALPIMWLEDRAVKEGKL